MTLARSMIKEAKFVSFVAVLQKLAPYFFASITPTTLVLSAFIHDLETLPVTNPNLYREFRAGKFAVQSTCTGFSKLAFAQTLEQNNKTIKAINANGYINVVNQEK